MKSIVIVILVTLALSLASQAAAAQPGNLHVVDAKTLGDAVVFAGYISRGYLEVPVAGYVRGGEGVMYIVGPFGAMARVEVINSSTAVAVGSLYAGGGMAAALVFIRPGSGAQGFAVTVRGGELYGADVIPEGSGLVFAGTFVNYSRGANVSRSIGESDCLVARLAGAGGRGVVVGSMEYDDYPIVLIRSGGGYALVGETWSHKVAQGAVFVARLSGRLELVDSYAYDTSGEDSVSDAEYYGGGFVVAGSTGTEKRDQAFIVLEGAGGTRFFESRFEGNGYADRLSGYLVSGTGEVGEKKVEHAYLYSIGKSLTFYRANGVRITPLSAGGEPLFLLGDNIIVRGDRAYCLAGGCKSAIKLEVLDASRLMDRYFYSTVDVRKISGVFVSKGLVDVHLVPLPLSEKRLNVSTVSVEYVRGVYVEKVDWSYRVYKFINDNLAALVLVVPLGVAALLAWIAARRKR